MHGRQDTEFAWVSKMSVWVQIKPDAVEVYPSIELPLPVCTEFGIIYLSSVPNLQISDLLLHFALPSPHDCGCSGAGRASVAAGPGAGCVGAAVGAESGNFATPAGVGSLLNDPQRLFAEASRSLLGKCCLGRRVVPWNSILDVMHKSVSIWSIANETPQFSEFGLGALESLNVE